VDWIELAEDGADFTEHDDEHNLYRHKISDHLTISISRSCIVWSWLVIFININFLDTFIFN
jgi:hypothetical protein